jgi:hypothetical protein
LGGVIVHHVAHSLPGLHHVDVSFAQLEQRHALHTSRMVQLFFSQFHVLFLALDDDFMMCYTETTILSD